jgi:ribonuclease HI
MSKTWQVFVDGASRGNPGKAGAGIYIKFDDKEFIKNSAYLGKKTNNQAEYLALLLALFFLKKELLKHKQIPEVVIISDSELLIKQMKGEYQVKNPILLQMKSLIDLLLENIDCKFKHVLREKNKIADELANKGIDSKKAIPVAFKKLLEKYQIGI